MNEQQKFLDWLREFDQRAYVGLNLRDWKTSPYYKRWVSLGSPMAKVVAEKYINKEEGRKTQQAKIDFAKQYEEEFGFAPTKNEIEQSYSRWMPKQSAHAQQAGALPNQSPPAAASAPNLAPTTNPSKAGTSGVEYENGFFLWTQYDQNGVRNIVDWYYDPNNKAAQDSALAKKVYENYATEANFQNRMMGGRTDFSELDLQRQYAGQYEQARNELMGKFTGSPRDWIKMWEVQNNPNPFASQRSQGQVEMDAWAESKKRADFLEPLAKAYQKVMKSGLGFEDETVPQFDAETAGRAQDIINSYKTAKDRQTALEELFVAQKQMQSGLTPSNFTPVGAGGGGTVSIGGQQVGVADPSLNEGGDVAPARPTLKTPDYLSRFVPQLQAGAELKKFSVAPPSGQQWAATPWSQRQGLAGYMDWSGQSYEDTLDQMSMRQTNTPRIAYSWKPARQMA
jgi:hypothetical protein